MTKNNCIFLGVTFCSIAAGVALPNIGEPLADVPTALMLLQLLLCFLACVNPTVGITREHLRGLPRYLVCKMLLIPILCWGAFQFVSPAYSLGALLLAGSAVGVMAPLIALLVQAEIFFVIGAVIASSLVMPLTLPLLTSLTALFSGQNTEGLAASFLRTGIFLGLCMLGPFATAKLLWSFRPRLAQGVLSYRFSLSMLCMAGSMLIIFSRFSAPLRNNWALAGESMVAALALAALLMLLGAVFGKDPSAPKQLAKMVGASAMNNVLMVIVSAQFFGLHEVLLSALYAVPFAGLIIPYQIYGARLNAKAARREAAREN